MKSFLTVIFSIILIFSFCGCQSKDNMIEKTPIKVNLPTDDSVNGYRNSDSNVNIGNFIIKETTENYKYFGNKNSKKFHKASCSALKNTKEENKVFYKTKDEFIKYNYSPCKICNP